MKQVMIHNQKNNHILGKNINEATGLYDRTKGLMFSRSMSGFDGLLIRACNSVHTCFMCYPLDLIFLDKHERVVKCIENKKPWRMTMFYFKASSTLELPVGTIKNANVVEGDQLRIEYV
jgi:uncharacterized protein